MHSNQLSNQNSGNIPVCFIDKSQKIQLNNSCYFFFGGLYQIYTAEQLRNKSTEERKKLYYLAIKMHKNNILKILQEILNKNNTKYDQEILNEISPDNPATNHSIIENGLMELRLLPLDLYGYTIPEEEYNATLSLNSADASKLSSLLHITIISLQERQKEMDKRFADIIERERKNRYIPYDEIRDIYFYGKNLAE